MQPKPVLLRRWISRLPASYGAGCEPSPTMWVTSGAQHSTVKRSIS
jgi:hypothetical protein